MSSPACSALGSDAGSQTPTNSSAHQNAVQPPVEDLRFFNPCAATASKFIYARGRCIVCCGVDTLTIERKFLRHGERVKLLAVSNPSEVGGECYVVSYDAGQTAIVWSLVTGTEVARFSSFDSITVATWVRNGIVAFG